MSFPVGKHDDICDALGLIGQMLATLQVGQQASSKKKKANDTGYRAFTNPSEMEIYTSGDDDAWSEHMMQEGLGDEKFSWKML